MAGPARFPPHVNFFALLVAVPLLFSVSSCALWRSPENYSELREVLKLAEDEAGIGAGAAVLRQDGQIVFQHAWGTTLPYGHGGKVSIDTPFDAASLTKPLAGAPAALLLMESRTMSSAEAQLLPALLNHTSGLSDLEENQQSGAYEYANQNYMAIQLLAERHGIEQADWRRKFWEPLGLQSPSFEPPAAVWSGVGARGDILLREPFDPRANRFLTEGRTPLHSGLFISSADAALFGEALLQRKIEKLSALLLSNPEPIESREGKVFISQGGMRSPSGPPYAHAGAKPGRIYYQTGYTGCLLWLDTEERVVFSLLTNAAAYDALDQWKEVAEQCVQAILISQPGD